MDVFSGSSVVKIFAICDFIESFLLILFCSIVAEALDWMDDRSEEVYLDTSSVNVEVDISNGMMVFLVC